MFQVFFLKRRYFYSLCGTLFWAFYFLIFFSISGTESKFLNHAASIKDGTPWCIWCLKVNLNIIMATFKRYLVNSTLFLRCEDTCGGFPWHFDLKSEWGIGKYFFIDLVISVTPLVLFRVHTCKTYQRIWYKLLFVTYILSKNWFGANTLATLCISPSLPPNLSPPCAK